MGKTNPRKVAWIKRKQRVSRKLHGTAERPRLSIFRSNNHMYAQVIDDDAGNTLAAANSRQASVALSDSHTGNITTAKAVGKAVAEAAKAKGIKKVVFDRNGFLYHGRVKALADAAREAGLEF